VCDPSLPLCPLTGLQQRTNYIIISVVIATLGVLRGWLMDLTCGLSLRGIGIGTVIAMSTDAESGYPSVPYSSFLQPPTDS